MKQICHVPLPPLYAEASSPCWAVTPLPGHLMSPPPGRCLPCPTQAHPSTDTSRLCSDSDTPGWVSLHLCHQIGWHINLQDVNYIPSVLRMSLIFFKCLILFFLFSLLIQFLLFRCQIALAFSLRVSPFLFLLG